MKLMAVLLSILALNGCGISHTQPGFQIVSESRYLPTGHQWLWQVELTLPNFPVASRSLQDDYAIGFNREFVFNSPMLTRQITLSWRCKDCPDVVGFKFRDTATHEFIIVPIEINGTQISGVLTVPVNKLISGLDVNVVSVRGGNLQMMLLGERFSE